MTDAAHVIKAIQDAFSGVQLGDGVGLTEGQGLDDWLSEPECALLRQRDEKLDWARLTPEQLVENECSLSYFDPYGMRFHLPAFMIAYLRSVPLFGGVVFALTNLDEFKISKFAVLSAAQRTAVREFLLCVSDNSDGWLSVDDIRVSLSEYWTS